MPRKSGGVVHDGKLTGQVPVAATTPATIVMPSAARPSPEHGPAPLFLAPSLARSSGRRFAAAHNALQDACGIVELLAGRTGFRPAAP